MFTDKFNREIKIGHVLANGGRDDCSGIIRTGIVRGFTERSILVDMIIPVGGYSDASGRYTQWTTRRGSFREPKNCLITGLDSATFLESVNSAFTLEPVLPAPANFIDTTDFGPILNNVLSRFRTPLDTDTVDWTKAIIYNGSFLPPDPVDEPVNIDE